MHRPPICISFIKSSKAFLGDLQRLVDAFCHLKRVNVEKRLRVGHAGKVSEVKYLLFFSTNIWWNKIFALYLHPQSANKALQVQHILRK